jgi:tetratricopeptide (TPR) repeat protein
LTHKNYCYTLVGKLDNNHIKLLKEYEKDITIDSIKFNVEKIESKLKDGKVYTIFFIKELILKRPIIKKTLTSYNNIAYYLQKAGANEEAVYLLKKIVAKFPNRTVAYYNLGDAYWALGEKDKARKAYTTYIEQMCNKGLQKKIPKVVLKRVEVQ